MSRYWFAYGHTSKHFLQLGSTGDFMSLSFMNRHSLRTALMTALVITAGACSDQPITSSVKPVTPPVPAANQTGMLRGTVREDGSVILESLDPTITTDSNVSGAIYGNANVTARISTYGFHVDSNGTTKTWTFKLAVHNLLTFPIGAIDGAASPADTIGMYVFFPGTPTVISPTNCGCSVTVKNPSGFANFTAINQSYYWYHDRLATSGSAGDSTTTSPTWTFTAPLTGGVKSFRFFVILSSPWPRGLQSQDTSWTVQYNPASDSLPDTNAKPRWKRIGVQLGGTESIVSSALNMRVTRTSGNNYDDMYFFRSDNLARTEKAYEEARVSLPDGNGNPQVILALLDSVKFVAMGIGKDRVGFVTFNQFTSQWQWNAATRSANGTSGSHRYRVAKYGADSAMIYVDDVAKLGAQNSVLPANFLVSQGPFLGSQAAKMSSFFGVTAQDNATTAIVSSVTYAFHVKPNP